MDQRPIVGYIRRDDISWWAGCRYADGRGESYITETACITKWGAISKAKRLAKAARRLRRRGLDNFRVDVGEAS